VSKRTLRGKVAIAGVGETPYYRHGKAPVSEFKLALQAILAACEDAGIDPRRIDGFASYSNDRNDPSRIAAALGLPANTVAVRYRRALEHLRARLPDAVFDEVRSFRNVR
jgi:enamine deaminase RidA (YjgF/YER057c/UK114 family)